MIIKHLVKGLMTFVLMVAMATSAAASGSDNTKATDSDKGKEKRTQVSMLANNGKILSRKGVKAIKETDILSVWVKKDTVIFELKKEGFIRLDKDQSNYIIVNKGKNKDL